METSFSVCWMHETTGTRHKKEAWNFPSCNWLIYHCQSSLEVNGVKKLVIHNKKCLIPSITMALTRSSPCHFL